MSTLREGLLAHTLECTREREHERAAYLERLHATLLELAEEGVDLEPFPHGTILDQFGYELNTLRIEFGDPRAAARRVRRNKKISVTTRRAVYRRDGYRCVECGWSSPRSRDARIIAHRSGRFLTIDHIIPLAEGGPNHNSNMRTLCSDCNPAKGHKLPESVPAVAA